MRQRNYDHSCFFWNLTPQYTFNTSPESSILLMIGTWSGRTTQRKIFCYFSTGRAPCSFFSSPGLDGVRLQPSDGYHSHTWRRHVNHYCFSDIGVEVHTRSDTVSFPFCLRKSKDWTENLTKNFLVHPWLNRWNQKHTRNATRKIIFPAHHAKRGKKTRTATEEKT